MLEIPLRHRLIGSRDRGWLWDACTFEIRFIGVLRQNHHTRFNVFEMRFIDVFVFVGKDINSFPKIVFRYILSQLNFDVFRFRYIDIRFSPCIFPPKKNINSLTFDLIPPFALKILEFISLANKYLTGPIDDLGDFDSSPRYAAGDIDGDFFTAVAHTLFLHIVFGVSVGSQSPNSTGRSSPWCR
ncbi:MAG: hypothetical protein ISN28_09855 [Ectothiorhodospiraceae bacterium AqS1]|nr:hypothetical protein [Ectothiorhodospiraceae bacterium AqS1]